jgi:hypothetical protein
MTKEKERILIQVPKVKEWGASGFYDLLDGTLEEVIENFKDIKKEFSEYPHLALDFDTDYDGPTLVLSGERYERDGEYAKRVEIEAKTEARERLELARLKAKYE